jgi:hypothetical protein
MIKKAFGLLVGLLAVFGLLLSGCVYEPLETDLNTRNIYPIATNTYDVGSLALQFDQGYFREIYLNGVLLAPGGLEVDPVFTASDAFPITAAWIAAWNAHPALTTGTHGVAGTIVGTSDAQSLTNKNLTMNNNVPIYWKDTLGATMEVFNIWLDNNLDILYNEDADIFIWEGAGTGQTMHLWPEGSTAGSTLKDSPTLDFIANYWDATNKNWEAKIIHNMITAGAAPKSRLEFEIQGEDILRLENDNGTVSTLLSGNVHVSAGSIDMSQIGAEPSSTANRAGIYAIDLSADNCTIGFFTETAVETALGIASENRMPIRWNGNTYYLLAENSSFRTPIVNSTRPTVGQGLQVGIIFYNLGTDTWEKCTSISPVTWVPLSSGGAAAWGTITGNITSQTDLNTALGDRELIVNKGAASGYAPLDANSKVPVENLGTLPKSPGNLYLRDDQTWATVSVAWGSITGNITSQTDLQSALDSKLSTVTGAALDNVFSSNGLLKRTGSATYAVDNSTYLTSYTETDPVVKALTGIIVSNGSTISAISNNSSSWNTAYGWGNHASAGYLTSVTGTNLDNVFSSNGLLKRTGTGTYTVDSSAYLTGNQNITLSGDLSGSGATSISANVSGIGGKTLPALSAGLLRYSGSAFSYDSASYLTGNQNITVSGDVGGSGTTSISANVSGIGGKSLPALSAGFLRYSGSDWSYDSSAYLTANQNITLSGDLSGSGTTSISGTVSGIQGKAITLATGFLKYSGSAWTFDSSTYLTANQNISLTGAVTGSGTTSIATTLTGAGLDNVFSSSGLLKRTGTATYTVDASTYLTANQNITLSGDASGSGTTSISVTNAGLKGVALPALSTGYLYYSGSGWAFQTTGWTAVNPSWYGKLYATRGNCDPVLQASHENMLGVSGPTPTAITASLARCVQFTPPADITVTNIRLFGVGATTSLYKFAIYPVGSGTTKIWDSGTVTTATNTWLNLTTGLPITLTAGTKYWWCVTAVSTGTTAGFRSEAAPLGTNYWGASAAPIGNSSLGLPVYAQFAVSTGVFPTTLPTIASAAYAGGTTGTVPFGLLDYGGQK